MLYIRMPAYSPGSLSTWLQRLQTIVGTLLQSTLTTHNLQVLLVAIMAPYYTASLLYMATRV